MENAATIIGMVRDVALLMLLVMTLVAVVVILSLVSKVKRTVEKAEQVIDTVSKWGVFGPATSNPGLFHAFGRAASFFTGLLSNRRDVK
ncbi:hypothetical protein M1N23_01940 [Dehalococcoidia bacterium]|nr:hypothetical protein [Dehalococcoidia bacterium]